MDVHPKIRDEVFAPSETPKREFAARKICERWVPVVLLLFS